MAILQNVWWLLVLIGVMILIHELGHYWAARLFDVRVETFSIGFGPRLFGFKKGDTDFRFSAILFGGYVKMAGDQPGDEAASDPGSLQSKPRWQRLIVVFAGPFMNMVLAVAVLAGVYMVHYEKLPSNSSPVIGYVVPDGAAAKAGVHDGDRIVQIGNTVNPTWEDIAIKEAASAGHALSVWVKRDGQRRRLEVTPVLDQKSGLGFAGWAEESQVEIADVVPGMNAEKAGLRKGDLLVSINGQPVRSTPKLHDVITHGNGQAVQIVFLRGGQKHEITVTPAKSNLDGATQWMIGALPQMRTIVTQLPFPQAVRESVRQNIKGAALFYEVIKGIAERRMSPKSLSGPIGIAQASGEAAREGPTAFFELMAMVSTQLATLNLLPVPILDGGVIVLLLMEMFLRRDLSLQVKETITKIGFVFLMAVMVFAIYNDISKILPG